MQEIIEKAKLFVKEFFSNDFSGHDYEHTMRVYKNAKDIAEKEKADTFICEMAALLHDVDDEKISPNTSENKENARKFLLENGVEKTEIEKIIDVISQISFRNNHGKTPSSIEAMCVQDADRLDAIGAIGVARAFAFGGSKNRNLYGDIENLSLEMEYSKDSKDTLSHFYEKLFKIKDLMNTSYGRQIAIERHKFMEKFVEEFLEEIKS